MPSPNPPRLELRPLTLADAPFILELVNEPSWLRFIGDRGVRSLADAEGYLERGPLASYAQHGFGLELVVERATGEPMGICGILKRDTLDAPDLGFAFVPRFWGRGYALEAARATLAAARARHGVKRVLAITSLDNEASIRLLGKLGFRFERELRLTADDPVKLFALGLVAE